MSSNLVGKIFLERYRVEAFIAAGGMGVVYRVWDIQRSVPLTMKTLHPELADDLSILKRFKREANALKKLAHPNIVPFYGFFQVDELYFLLERFIEGQSLQEVLRKQGKLPVSEALVYLKAMCAALGYAHANGVVHCDVKPGNVMIDQGGNIYLIDFGIARHADSGTTTLATAGTTAYMAPEQVRGETVNPTTDVYALGVVLFELLTGQRPFKGSESGIESSGPTANERIRYAHKHLPPPDPRTLNPGIPAELVQVILKALSKEPAERYAGGLEFYAAIMQAAGLADAQIPTIVTDHSVKGETGVSHTLSAPAKPYRRLPNRLVMAGGTGIFLILLVAGIVLLGGNLPEASSGEPTTDQAEVVGATPINKSAVPKTVLPSPSPPPPSRAASPSPTLEPTLTPIPQPTATPRPMILLPSSINASGYDTAGSKDAQGNPTSYEPLKAIDGQPITAWRENGHDGGMWLELSFNPTIIVSQVGIIPGYDKIDPADNTDRFYQNYAVKEIQIEFSDGTVLNYTFEHERRMQFLQVDRIQTRWIRIKILSTYPPQSSQPRDFTAISEVEVMGWQP